MAPLDHRPPSNTVAILARITVAAISALIGLWLIIGSTMGPTIMPEVAEGGLDMAIRLGMLGIGLLVWSAAAIWLLWPVARRLYQLIHRQK